MLISKHIGLCYIILSKHELYIQQYLFISVNAVDKHIYRYTDQAIINKSMSNKTNNLFRLDIL